SQFDSPTCSFINTAGYIRVHCHGMAVIRVHCHGMAVKQHSQFDCHTMTMHPDVTGRIYEAAGGGYAESRDGGATWETINAGLKPYTYLVNIAVDRGNPDTIIAAAAKGAHSAYRPSSAHTVIVRSEAGNPCEIVNDGLLLRMVLLFFRLSPILRMPVYSMQ